MKTLGTTLLALSLALPLLAQEPANEMPKDGKPEELKLPRETPGKAEETPPETGAEESGTRAGRPPLELVIVPGEATSSPYRHGVSFANGGVVDVIQPNPTTLVVTMSGLAATNAALAIHSAAGYHFDLMQLFEVCFHSRRIKRAHLTLEGRVIGLLRTNHQLYTCNPFQIAGTASTDPAIAAISCGDADLVGVTLPARSVTSLNDLSVYNHEGPLCVPVTPGKYTLHQKWGFGTSHPPFLCRGASAEFSPQPQYYSNSGSYWFQHFLPFNGLATRDFGFQVTIKVIGD